LEAYALYALYFSNKTISVVEKNGIRFKKESRLCPNTNAIVNILTITIDAFSFCQNKLVEYLNGVKHEFLPKSQNLITIK
jgi:hypothetical protein